MRKKDWADEIAERLYDVLVESERDDQRVFDAVAKQLRAAFFAGLQQKQKGITFCTAGNGDKSYYVCTAPRNPSQGERAQENQTLLVSQLGTETARGYKLTWDGNESEKGPRGKKKVRSSNE